MAINIARYPWFEYSENLENGIDAEKLFTKLLLDYRDDMTTDELIFHIVDGYSLVRHYSLQNQSIDEEATSWQIIGSRLARIGLWRLGLRAHFQAIRLFRKIYGNDYSVACVCIDILGIFKAKNLYPLLSQQIEKWATQEIEEFERIEEPNLP